MNADSKESAFQQDIIDQMVAGGWKLGEPAKYDRKLALYTEDCLQYVKTTQPKTWEKYEKLYPCLLYTSPSPRDQRGSRMPSSA